MFKSLVLIGLLSNASAETNNLRRTNEIHNQNEEFASGQVLHLDLEVMVNGERELFPLMPGTKCPTGHTCRTRIGHTFVEGPMISSLKANLNNPITEAMNWDELSNDLNTVVNSENRCTRRQAMARAAGLVAGATVATVSAPAYAAETKEVLMGSDSGLLAFVPQKTSICKGDSVKWYVRDNREGSLFIICSASNYRLDFIVRDYTVAFFLHCNRTLAHLPYRRINNKSGPHNVVFDEDAIPAGVSQEKISMDDQLGEEGDTFTMSFQEPGEYGYYCEPHRGAGMVATLIVA